MTSICINGKTIDSIDSIRVVGLQYSILEFSRYNFLKEIEECKRLYKDAENESFESRAQVAYVDSMLTNKDGIKAISNFSKLKKLRKMSYDTQCHLSDAYYNQTNGSIIWSPEDTQTPTLLLVLFSKDKVAFVWLYDSLVDIGKYRYKMSKELAKALSRYTRIYDGY